MLAPLLILVACRDPGDPGDRPADTGADAWSSAYPLSVSPDGQPMLAGSLDGVDCLWALDTGASSFFVDDDLATGSRGYRAAVTVGPVSYEEARVQPLDLAEVEAYLGVDLGGLAGGAFFADRVVVLDYPGRRAWFHDALPEDAPPGTTGVAADLPYALQADVPVVELDVGAAAPVPLVADTGSGVTLIPESVFAGIDDGTLPRLEGYVWKTTYGEDDAFVTRIPSLGAGDLAVAGTWAVVVPDDHHLAALFERAGIAARGFLGYPFYRELVVGVDGPGSAFRLWGAEGGGQVDPREWTRVGVELVQRDGGFLVEMVYRPSDADDRGLIPGDRVAAVDGAALDGLSLDEARALLRGEAGETRTLSLSRQDGDLDVDVAVDALLPPL